MQIEASRQEGAYSEDTLCVGLARLGADDQTITVGSMKDLKEVDFGEPLHSLVIVGDTHPIEDEVLDMYRLEN